MTILRRAGATAALIFAVLPAVLAEEIGVPGYEKLRREFVSPDHARWGEVPLWWWEGQPITKEGITAELELLASKGVKAVCPIQRSPGRCSPASFTPEWWERFAHANAECKRLGMTLWAYDQVGYGHYGWLEKAAGEVQDPRTKRISFHQAEGSRGDTIHIELPEGDLLAARAYRLKDGKADDKRSEDIRDSVSGNVLQWKAKRGDWRVAVMVAVPFQSFYLSDTAGDAFIDMFYGKIERTLGKDSMGTSFVGVFQDEHPPTPRDLYTEELAGHFQKRFGYDIARALPAQHFDVGPLTPKYRTDFFDAYLDVVERTYWRRVYDWTMDRGLLTSHDNWGRNDITRQSEGYIDYFRTQRWFSAPGYDDAGERPLTERNYYDTKIASSIARLYGRQRVWNEAFHSSGWGRTTNQTLSWLTTGMVFGANLYDEHGLYYSTNASTWEHAAPDPHWRQPYWTYYQTLSDFVARTSYLMSQGQHVVDAAVHYPAVSLLADLPRKARRSDPNTYMRVSHTIYTAGIDNDIIDDDSILNGRVENGTFVAGGNAYQALVFGPERTIRRSVLDKVVALVETGGTVLFFGSLPTASTEAGRDDPTLQKQLAALLGVKPGELPKETVERSFPSGGFCAFLPGHVSELPRFITNHIDRDVLPNEPTIYVSHRRMNALDVYMVQNALEGQSNTIQTRFRVDGVPELWDPFTGKLSEVDGFERRNGYTHVTHRIEGNTAVCIVFRPGETMSKPSTASRPQPDPISLSEDWTFDVIPTRDNRWGEFRWPPSDKKIGPEVRRFRYRSEALSDGPSELAQPDYDDSQWQEVLYSTGPYWLVRTITDDNAINAALANVHTIVAGDSWQEVRFSQSIAAARAAPWGGHSGYPDGHIDKNFIHLPTGRNLLFTRIRSPKVQRRGLRVELRNSSARLWVNGVEQPFEDAVGNLPLEAGENTVLLELPDGGHGRLFVQAEPPSISTMEEAAKGSVKPDIEKAKWIWSGDTVACSTRKTFTLDEVPAQARIVVSGFSGYRLFVNGVKLEEEIGPWSNWTRPESFTVTSHLREGKNVIAVWGQLFAGQNVNKGQEAFNSRGVVLAFKMRFEDGEELGFVTDETWKGTAEDIEGWESPDFDDSGWAPVRVAGVMGDEPWGMQVVENVGMVTEPDRPLSVNLDSPYLTCFDEVSDIVYDVKQDQAPRVGWYRFDAPPGLRRLILPTDAKVQAWVNGEPATVEDGVATVASPPAGVSQVALRLEMEPGAYGGAAFAEPIGLDIARGTIQPGPWADFALPTYSGIGVYTQTVMLSEDDLQHELTLDLGEVLVAAEVFVNDQSVGVRLARPFTFDITDTVRAGANTIRVHVANTIAPHYQTIPAQNLGPTASGLIGPVTIRRELAGDRWTAWAESEANVLQHKLDTPTPERDAAQRAWEETARWHVLEPIDGAVAADGTVCMSDTRTCDFALPPDIDFITGVRFEATAEGPDNRSLTAEKRRKTLFGIGMRNRGALPVHGKRLRIEIPDRGEYLALAEVEVFSGGKNVARTGKAHQSTTGAGGVPERAIDGNTDGAFHNRSVSHTNNTMHPRWELDLPETVMVDRIVVWNRTDGDLEKRLKGAELTLFDESDTRVFQYRFNVAPAPKVELVLTDPIPLPIRAASSGRVSKGPPRWLTPFSWEDGEDLRLDVGSLEVGDSQCITLTLKGDTGECGKVRLSVHHGSTPLADIPPEIDAILAKPRDKRNAEEAEMLAVFYRTIDPIMEPERQRLAALRRALEAATGF